MLRWAVVHWCQVLEAAGHDKGAVGACPDSAVGAYGAEGDLVTSPVVACGKVGWEHWDCNGAVGQLDPEGTCSVRDKGTLGAVCRLP
jgi:hypothetical protein